jgi:NAD(P)-dependent dehydrogenase (short-subunit alcohol dehydrogenase family)
MGVATMTRLKGKIAVITGGAREMGASHLHARALEVRVAELAQSVVNLLWDELSSNLVVHCDETAVQVLKEAGKPPTPNSYMWALAAGPPQRAVVLFDYNASRSRAVSRPQTSLKAQLPLSRRRGRPCRY